MGFNSGFKGLINVYYIPIYAQKVVYMYTKSTPTYFGVNTPSSGSLQLC